MGQGLISGIVYLARKLHWTREEIGKLSPIQFGTIIKELQEQEAQEEYNKNYRTASLMAAIYNTIPRKNRRVFTPKDFLPEREQDIIGKSKSNLDKLAEDKGIIMPKYKQQKE